jgi:hypothetical protein
MRGIATSFMAISARMCGLEFWCRWSAVYFLTNDAVNPMGAAINPDLTVSIAVPAIWPDHTTFDRSVPKNRT